MSGAPGPGICIEVVHAAPQRVVARTYWFAAPMSVAEVLDRAASDPAFAAVDLRAPAVGVFGRLAALTDMLSNGDRLELYRPLATDPKTARRARVREARRRR